MDRDQPIRNRLTRRAALLAAAKFIAFGMSVLMPLVLVRTLSLSEFGLYKQAFLIISTGLMLFGLQGRRVGLLLHAAQPFEEAADRHERADLLLADRHDVSRCCLRYSRAGSRYFSRARTSRASMPLIGLAILLWLVSSFLEIVAVADGMCARRPPSSYCLNSRGPRSYWRRQSRSGRSRDRSGRSRARRITVRDLACVPAPPLRAVLALV